MSKLDKKIISITLIIIMVLTQFTGIVNAATEPEGTVHFKDKKLEKLLFDSSKTIDANKDGYITKNELSNIKYFSFSTYSTNYFDFEDNKISEDGYKEFFSYVKNLKSLSFSKSAYPYSVLDISDQKELQYFSFNTEGLANVPTIKFADSTRMFRHVQGNSLQAYSLNNIGDFLYVNQVVSPIGNFTHVFKAGEITVGNPNIVFVGIPNGKSYVTFKGLKEGTTTVKFSNSLNTKELKITVKPAKNNPSPALKTNTDSAELYFDHVLTASGNLYEFDYNNPKSSMKKIDSNVSKYIYGYNASIYLKGNVATAIYINGNGNKITKTIGNIKEVGANFNTAAYLTSNNELYNVYVENNNWKVKKIATGVNGLIDSACYYKDGKTYSLDGNVICDGKADKAYYFGTTSTYVAVGNKLYRYRGLGYLFIDNFSKFEYNNYQIPNNIVAKDGKKTELFNLIWTAYFYYEFDNSNTVKYTDDDFIVMTKVKNTSHIKVNGKEYYLILRSDGSVWIETEKYKAATCILDNTKSNNQSAQIQFKDTPKTAWYYNAVAYVYSNNIIKGYNDSTFAPNDNLTRGMLATILYRMEGEQKVTGTPKFPDVQDSSKFYYKAVKWATDNNIVAGYNNGNFGPEDNITREQLAVILNRYASYKKKDVSKTNDLKKFSDTSKISDYAVNALKWAVGSGVVTGNANGTLNPKGMATRAEVAAMMEKYCKNVGR